MWPVNATVTDHKPTNAPTPSKRDIRTQKNKTHINASLQLNKETSYFCLNELIAKETKSATMNIFRFFFYFLFKSFVKVELSYVFTLNLFTIAENARKSELPYKTGVFFSCW